MATSARINQAKYNTFLRIHELSVTKKLAIAVGIACLTGLAAQIRVPLPWSPVPITGQTFAVLLAAALLGRWWGGASMFIYAGLGAAGLPWFTGWNGGLAYLAGPTGGYILGFILAGLFLGYFTDTYIKARSLPSLIGLMFFTIVVFVYIPGLIQLGLWLHFIKGEAVSLTGILNMGAIPFIAGDLTKAFLAAIVARSILPKLSYSREKDK